MKIAQLLYSGLGGHGSVAFSLMDGAVAQGRQFTMGFLGIEPLLPAYQQRCVEKNAHCTYFKAIPGRPYLSWRKIVAWLWRERPDVLVLHSINAVVPCLVYTAATRTPLIFVEHQANALKRRSEWLASRIGMRLASRVVCLTQGYASDLAQALGAKYRAGKVVVIPNGIDTRRFTVPPQPVLQRSRVVLGMAARFTNLRHQDVLVETLEKLAREVPDVDWQLSLAGDGETFERIHALVREKALEARVKLTGHLDEAELIDWFHSLDIYVHATKGETLSTSMLQAMACGRPMVASRVPGVENLLTHPRGFGVLVDGQNAADFAAAIRQMVENPEGARSMARAARHVAETEYGHDIMAARYAALVDELTHRSSRTGRIN